MRVRGLLPEDGAWVARTVATHFGTSQVVSRGVLHDARELPGLVAERVRERCGLLQYRLEGTSCEVVILIADPPRRGAGTRLLEAFLAQAPALGARRVWLVTTNDNRDAQAFYRARGGRVAAVHRGAVAEARKRKPEIPLRAADGTPIEDEIEFEWAV